MQSWVSDYILEGGFENVTEIQLLNLNNRERRTKEVIFGIVGGILSLSLFLPVESFPKKSAPHHKYNFDFLILFVNETSIARQNIIILFRLHLCPLFCLCSLYNVNGGRAHQPIAIWNKAHSQSATILWTR